MAALPAVPSFGAGSFDTSAQLNQLAAAVSFLLNPPRALVYKSVSSSRASSLTSAVVNWDTVITNSDGGWAGASPSRLTCNTPGLYHIEAAVEYASFSGSPTTAWEIWLGVARNSASTFPGGGSANALCGEERPIQTSVGEYASVSFTYFLSAGDYLEVFTSQVSGGSQTLIPNANYYSGHFGMTWRAVS